MKQTIEERHEERDRGDAEQVEREQEALSKLYRLEYFVASCGSCGGHRQSRYVPVESCEHGKYDSHRVASKLPWAATVGSNPCPGAGLEDAE